MQFFFSSSFQSIVLANPDPEANPDPAADPHALFFGKESSHKGSSGTVRVLRCRCRRRKLPKCTKDEDSGEEDGVFEPNAGGCLGSSCSQIVPIPFPIPINSGGNRSD